MNGFTTEFYTTACSDAIPSLEYGKYMMALYQGFPLSSKITSCSLGEISAKLAKIKPGRKAWVLGKVPVIKLWRWEHSGNEATLPPTPPRPGCPAHSVNIVLHCGRHTIVDHLVGAVGD